MTFRPTTSTEFAPAHYFRLPACPHCGAMLLAPESSEFLGDGHMRHTWSCEDCGHEFRTAISYAQGRIRARHIA